MPQSHFADLRNQLAMMGEILTYSWANVDLILMVLDVKFTIPSDCEVPDSFEMFKTIVAWPRIFEKHSAIVTQSNIGRTF